LLGAILLCLTQYIFFFLFSISSFKKPYKFDILFFYLSLFSFFSLWTIYLKATYSHFVWFTISLDQISMLQRKLILPQYYKHLNAILNLNTQLFGLLDFSQIKRGGCLLLVIIYLSSSAGRIFK